MGVGARDEQRSWGKLQARQGTGLGVAYTGVADPGAAHFVVACLGVVCLGVGYYVVACLWFACLWVAYFVAAYLGLPTVWLRTLTMLIWGLPIFGLPIPNLPSLDNACFDIAYSGAVLWAYWSCDAFVWRWPQKPSNMQDLHNTKGHSGVLARWSTVVAVWCSQ